MKSKMIFIFVILVVMTSFVIGISEVETDGDPTLGELTIGSVAEELVCTNGAWVQDGDVLDPQPVCSVDGVSCCAIGNTCNVETGACDPVEVLPEICGNFKDKNSCENGLMDPNFIYDIVAQNLIDANIITNGDGIGNADLGTDFCNNVNDNFYFYKTGNSCRVLKGPCDCEWALQNPIREESDTNPGSCVGTFSEFEASCNDINDPPSEPPEDIFPETECRQESEGLIDNCDSSGFYSLSWTAQIYEVIGGIANPTGETSLTCQSDQETYACPESLSTNIPFFSFINFLMTLSLVAIVYFFMMRRR